MNDCVMPLAQLYKGDKPTGDVVQVEHQLLYFRRDRRCTCGDAYRPWTQGLIPMRCHLAFGHGQVVELYHLKVYERQVGTTIHTEFRYEYIGNQ